MQTTFDSAKNRTNIAKHGVSLGLADALDWDSAIAMQDTRVDYGEVRMIGYGPIADRLYCVVYTDRPDSRHIISLRKANRREVDRYEQR